MPVLENARQERFAQALVRGLGQAAAYAAAGYQPDEGHASRLASNGKVAARVAELHAEAAEAACLTREWVITRLMRNAERAMQAEPVLDSEGAPTGEYTYQGTVANGALKTLAEMLPPETVSDSDVPEKKNPKPDDVAASLVALRQRERDAANPHGTH